LPAQRGNGGLQIVKGFRRQARPQKALVALQRIRGNKRPASKSAAFRAVNREFRIKQSV
jgi:hypothetical protein